MSLLQHSTRPSRNNYNNTTYKYNKTNNQNQTPSSRLFQQPCHRITYTKTRRQKRYRGPHKEDEEEKDDRPNPETRDTNLFTRCAVRVICRGADSKMGDTHRLKAIDSALKHASLPLPKMACPFLVTPFLVKPFLVTPPLAIPTSSPPRSPNIPPLLHRETPVVLRATLVELVGSLEPLIHTPTWPLESLRATWTNRQGEWDSLKVEYANALSHFYNSQFRHARRHRLARAPTTNPLWPSRSPCPSPRNLRALTALLLGYVESIRSVPSPPLDDDAIRRLFRCKFRWVAHTLGYTQPKEIENDDWIQPALETLARLRETNFDDNRDLKLEALQARAILEKISLTERGGLASRRTRAKLRAAAKALVQVRTSTTEPFAPPTLSKTVIIGTHNPGLLGVSRARHVGSSGRFSQASTKAHVIESFAT